MADVRSEGTRAGRLDRAIHDLLTQSAEIEAAAVVSFDGLPMASVLPAAMDEDRVAAMSAALLSLGERATVGLGRGELSQVFIEGEHGTVFLVSAENEAVLVAVAVKGAKTGMMLYEVKRAAARVAEVLRAADAEPATAEAAAEPAAVGGRHASGASVGDPAGSLLGLPPLPSLEPTHDPSRPSYAGPADPGLPGTYAPLGTSESNGSGTSWS